MTTYHITFLFISGLNLQSQFNLDNITVFNKNEQESTLGQKVNDLDQMLNKIKLTIREML